MLHTFFQLERPLLVFDTETTGNRPDDARIVELGFQKFTSSGIEREWRGYINPGMPIPPEAIEVHHITDEMVADRPRFKDIADNIARGFSDCDFAGKNIRFDLRVMKGEMKRAGIPWTYEGARIICIDRLEQLLNPRDLSTLYERYTGKKPVDAHSALADVVMSVELLCAQLEVGKERFPWNLDYMHKAMWPDWVDSEGFFRWRGQDVVISFGKHQGKKLREVPNDYLRWITGADFPERVKAIAAEAMIGHYPERE